MAPDPSPEPQHFGSLVAILVGVGAPLWGCAQVLGLSEYESSPTGVESMMTSAGGAGAGGNSSGGASHSSGLGSASGAGGLDANPSQSAAAGAMATVPQSVMPDGGVGEPGACGARGAACCGVGLGSCGSHWRCDPSIGTCVPCGKLERLGTLPGDLESQARAVSADGRVVIGRASSGPFRWTSEGGMRRLAMPDEVPGFMDATAEALSGDGSIIVGLLIDSEGISHAYRWDETSGMVDLGRVPGVSPDVYAFATADAISRDGRTIVGTATGAVASIGQAFFWTPETGLVNLADLPDGIGGSFSGATAVNPDGNVVVGRMTNEDFFERPFIWSAVTRETLRLVDFPLGSDSVPTAVDATGDVVVGYIEIRNSQGRAAFRWTRDTDRSELIEPDSLALDVDGTGTFVVGLGTTGAIVWSPDAGTRSVASLLDSMEGLLGLEEATGISEDGRVIVGSGFNEAGAREAWLVRFEGCDWP